MSSRYTFDSSFVNSGDLRTFLALNPKTVAVFRPTAGTDDLIHIDRTQEPHKLSYSQVAVQARSEFTDVLENTAPPILINRVGKVVSMNNAHKDGTCILIGSGPSLDVDFVKTLQDQGICVIALGNASYTYRAADYWIGKQSMQQYAPNAFLESRTKAIVPLQYKEESLWDFRNKKPTNHFLKNCPGVFFYKHDRYADSHMEQFFRSPSINDFGINSSIGLGISLAVCLGFSNIIFNGIDMGGEISDYYIFEEMPHKETYDRKTTEYSKFLTVFEDLHRELTERAIRIYSAGSSVFDIPELEKGYLERSTAKIAYLHMPPLTSPRGLTVPISMKNSYSDIFSKHRSKRVEESDFRDIKDRLLTDTEGLFDVPEVHDAYDRLEAKLGQNGCSSCAVRSLLSPVYKMFIAYHKKDPVNFSPIWHKVFPDKYTLLVGNELIFRDSEKHLKVEMDLMHKP
jgi:hypothetical protein